MKIVINTQGNFSLSKKACEFLGIPCEKGGREFFEEDKRIDPKLIECVEKLGEKANGCGSRLKVVEIPDDVNWVIKNWGREEWISEVGRVWY